MADEIILKYKIDTSDFEKVETAVEDVTAKTKKLGNEIKSTFADKSLTDSTKELIAHGNLLEEMVNNYGSVKGAVNAVRKEIESLNVANKKDTDEYKAKMVIYEQLSKKQKDLAQETKKAFSDTRPFDLMVQGARGVTAAFSVATGVTAVFGKESEDLQKAILKVQGAMAALQGVQELANIATEKGGIATKIATGYQAAYTAVVGTSTGAMKAFRLALAATGIGLAIVGIALLVEHWETLNNKVRDFLGLGREIDTAKQGSEAINSFNKIRDTYDKEIELRKSKGEEIRALEKQRIKDQLAILEQMYSQNKTDVKFVEFYYAQKHDLNVKYNQLERAENKDRLDKLKDEKKQEREILNFDLGDYDKLRMAGYKEGSYYADGLKSGIEEGIDTTRVPQIPVTFKWTMPPAEQFEKFANEVADSLLAIQPMMQASASFINSIIGLETAALEQEKAKQLSIAGDNAKKREKIEKDFAIRSAEIARKQAIANKIFSIFDIAVNTATAITKQLSLTPLPAGAPLVALIAATGALQAAAVAAQPLPEIPKFAKGGQVLAGGRSKDGHLIGRSHRQGGILIEAEGGEYIWDKQTTAKHGEIIKAAHEKRLDDLILHRYVAPAMKSESDKQAQKAYDDYMLRQTIKQGHGKDKQNAEYIVRGVSQSVSELVNNSNRYR